MTNTELVKHMFQLFASGDSKSIQKLLAPDIRWNTMPGLPNGGKLIGIEAVYEKVFSYLKDNWSSWKAISERFIETNEGVFVTGYYEGTSFIIQGYREIL